MTTHLPNDKYPQSRKLSNIADIQTRFKAIAASGNPEEGLRLLAKLDSLMATQSEI